MRAPLYFAFAAILLLTSPAHLSAQAIDIQWTGGVDNQWHLPQNWAPDNVPDLQTENAIIPTTAGTIVFDANTAVFELTVSGPGTTIAIQNGRVFHHWGNELTNQGTIQVNANGGPGLSSIRHWDDCELLGFGTIELLGSPVLTKFETGLGAVVTQGVNHSIVGTGHLRAEFINNGLVSAQTPGATLSVREFPKTNNSVFEARDGGVLELHFFELTQDPLAQILAADGSRVDIEGVLATGGRLVTEGSGTCHILTGGDVFFEDVVQEGTLHLNGGSHLILNGSEFVNQGVIETDPENSTIVHWLEFGTASLLTGGGSVLMNNNANLVVAPAISLIHDTGHTLGGSFTLDGNLVNRGLLQPGQPTRWIPADGDLTFEAPGVVEFELAGTQFNEYDRFNATGTVVCGGTLQVALINGHLPQVGDTYKIIDAPTVMGVFDVMNLPAGLTIRYEADGVYLDVVTDSNFRRGDCNDDGSFNLADVVSYLGFLFPSSGGAPTLSCPDACDANDDSNLDLSDAIVALAALFGNPTSPLPAPFAVCGMDPTPDALGCNPFDNCP